MPFLAPSQATQEGTQTGNAAEAIKTGNTAGHWGGMHLAKPARLYQQDTNAQPLKVQRAQHLQPVAVRRQEGFHWTVHARQAKRCVEARTTGELCCLSRRRRRCRIVLRCRPASNAGSLCAPHIQGHQVDFCDAPAVQQILPLITGQGWA